MTHIRSGCALILCTALASQAAFAFPPQDPAAQPKYKITVLEDASKTKRGKKGRVSSDTVIKVTDENDVPVAGIAVAFAITKASGGAAFGSGSLSAVATTNAAGVATSGSFSAAATSSFTMSVTASVPGGAITAAVPVNAGALAAGAAGAGGGAAGAGAGAAGAGTAAGVSTGVIVGIVAGVAAAVAVGVVAAGGGDKTPNAGTPPAPPRGTISLGGGGVTFGPPR